jgi:sec-independent protein translocase protein TatB
MLSIPHIVVLLLVALVVLGPEKLPEVARTMGKAMAELRRVTGDFRYQIEGEMRDLDRQARLRELSQQKDIYEYQPPVETPKQPPAENTIGSPAAAPNPPDGNAPGSNLPDTKSDSEGDAAGLSALALHLEHPDPIAPVASQDEPAAAPTAPDAPASPEKPGDPHPA